MNRRDFLGTVAGISAGSVVVGSITIEDSDGWIEVQPLGESRPGICRLRCRLREGYEVEIEPDTDGKYRIPPDDYVAIIWDGEFLGPPFTANVFRGAG